MSKFLKQEAPIPYGWFPALITGNLTAIGPHPTAHRTEDSISSHLCSYLLQASSLLLFHNVFPS